MTRYYFDAIDGSAILDDVGEELPDFLSAQLIAGQIICDMTPEDTLNVWAGGQFRVVIRTDEGPVGSMVVTAVGDGRPTARWR